MWASIRRRLDLIVFVLGLGALLFFYGVAVGRYRLPPNDTIDNAIEAIKDLRDNWRHYAGSRSKYLVPTRREQGAVTIHDPQRVYDGLTLMTLYRQGGFGASLIRMDGTEVHRWDVTYSAAWPAPSHVTDIPPDWEADMHGSWLFPNGELMLNLAGSGMVRLDRCSRIVAQIDDNTHHSIDVLPNGEALIPAGRDYQELQAKWPLIQLGPRGGIKEDTFLRARPDGSIIEEVSILDLIFDNDWEALLLAGPDPHSDISSNELTHMNDVEMLRPEMAAAFPQFRPGDLMLSLHNLNTVLVIDGTSKRIKWSMTGPFIAQHDPDFVPNGHILLFDNRTGAENAVPRLGNSRLLEIDPRSREIVWSYAGSDEAPFYTRIRGMVQLLPNGNVLVSEPEVGRAFEVTREQPGRIVWEFINMPEPGFVGVLTQAHRYAADDLNFVGEPCDGTSPAAVARAGER